MRILIVKGDKTTAENLRQLLVSRHYQTDVVYDGSDGFDYALAGQYDLILMDIVLPKMDGFQLVSRLRDQRVSTPVLIVSTRSDVADRIAGLDAGADDYLGEPFDADELLARVRALTRRKGEVLTEVLTMGTLSLDCSTRQLSVGDQGVRLGYKEFEVMRLLMISQYAVISKDTLITKVWGIDAEAEDNNVEVYISFLRKKLRQLNSPVTISTIRKAGYHLTLPTEE